VTVVSDLRVLVAIYLRVPSDVNIRFSAVLRMPDPNINFASFVLSLAATAAVHFGDRLEPDATEPGPVDLQAAGQMIDILAVLEEKTRGNLTAEERQLLEAILYELRLRFVEAQGEEKRIITP
jgi:hypothetical protein